MKKKRDFFPIFLFRKENKKEGRNYKKRERKGKNNKKRKKKKKNYK